MQPDSITAPFLILIAGACSVGVHEVCSLSIQTSVWSALYPKSSDVLTPALIRLTDIMELSFPPFLISKISFFKSTDSKHV